MVRRRSAWGHSRPLLTASLALLLIAALPAPSLALPAGWTSLVKVFTAEGAPSHSLALDELSGDQHIATEGGSNKVGVWYLTNAGAGWTQDQVTTGDDHSPAIRVEDTIVYVAFRRSSGPEPGIHVMVDAGGGWDPIYLHNGADGPPSLAVHNGTIHVVFKDGSNRLRHMFGTASDAPADWTLETVDGTCCSGRPSLEVSPTGVPRVAYPDGTSSSPNGLKQATRNGSSWSVTTITSSRVTGVTLFVDVEGDSKVAYSRKGAGSWYATKPGSTWQFLTLDPGITGTPDLGHHSGSSNIVFGNGKLRFGTTSSIWFDVAFTTTGKDHKPQLEMYQGRPYVSFARSGSSSDGIFVTHKN